MKKQKNLYLSGEAWQFAELLISQEDSHFKTKKELAQLGFAIAYDNKDHRSFEISETENIADFGSIDEGNILSTIYKELYDDSDDEIVQNIERACSFGLLKIKEDFFDSGKQMLDWKKFNNSFG
jgi:hypothetical protein